jgi:hypothetical protein
MKPNLIVDVVAIAAFLALGLGGLVAGHHVAGLILLVVVGRLRPPTDGGGASSGGIATICFALGAPAAHAAQYLSTLRGSHS